MQTVKGEKVSKGRALQKLPRHSEFLCLPLLKRQRMNNLCGDVQPRAWMCAPVKFCLTIHAHMSWVPPPTASKSE